VEKSKDLYGCFCAKELALSDLLKIGRSFWAEWEECNPREGGGTAAADVTLLAACSDALDTMKLLCSPYNEHCALRDCCACPRNKLPALEAFSNTARCEWNISKKGQDSNGKTEHRMHTCSGTHRDFMTALYGKLNKFFWHEFVHTDTDATKRKSFDLLGLLKALLLRMVAETCTDQRELLRTALIRLLSLLMGERDYGENHTCHEKLEPQSMYWCYKQVTLMPYVMRRLGKLPLLSATLLEATGIDELFALLSQRKNELLAEMDAKVSAKRYEHGIKDYHVITSDYHAHDNNFSQNSERVVCEDCQLSAEQEGLVPLTWLVMWSDNANHFRQASEVLAVSHFKRQLWNKHGMGLVNNHTAPHHGSSEVDGVTFVCKREMREAESKGRDTKWGDSPRDGIEAPGFLTRRLGTGKLTPTGKSRSEVRQYKFPYLGQSDCVQTPEAKTLDGAITRKIFCIRGGGTPNLVFVRVLPCACLWCMVQVWDHCERDELHRYVNQKELGISAVWVEKEVREETARDVRITRGMEADQFVTLAGEKVKADVAVAVRADTTDPENRGYLFNMVKAAGTIYPLPKATTQNGVTFSRGTMVFKGRYYDRFEEGELKTGRHFHIWSDQQKQSPIFLFRASHVRFVLGKWSPSRTGGYHGKAVYELSANELQGIEEEC
jgi:hypothetical protein